jgi:type II restriction enzyme
MGWDEELADLIRQNWPIDGIFTLDDVYAHEAHFEALYPDNHFVREKLRQTLQRLRDQGDLEFVDDHGLYRRLL